MSGAAERTPRRKLFRKHHESRKEAPERSANRFPRPREDPFTEYLNGVQVNYDVHFKLSLAQRQALQATWHTISQVSSHSGHGKVSIMLATFQRIQRSDHFLRTIFLKASLVVEKNWGGGISRSLVTVHDHANLLAAWIDLLMQKLALSQYISLPIPGALKHARLKAAGMTWKHWEMFGEALSDTIFQQRIVRSYPEAAQAWRIFVSTLIDNLRAHFDRYHPERDGETCAAPERPTPQPMPRSQSAEPVRASSKFSRSQSYMSSMLVIGRLSPDLVRRTLEIEEFPEFEEPHIHTFDDVHFHRSPLWQRRKQPECGDPERHRSEQRLGPIPSSKQQHFYSPQHREEAINSHPIETCAPKPQKSKSDHFDGAIPRDRTVIRWRRLSYQHLQVDCQDWSAETYDRFGE